MTALADIFGNAWVKQVEAKFAAESKQRISDAKSKGEVDLQGEIIWCYTFMQKEILKEVVRREIANAIEKIVSASE